jgi:hypothetical protein
MLAQRNILETEKGYKNYGEWTPQLMLTLPPVLALLVCIAGRASAAIRITS